LSRSTQAARSQAVRENVFRISEIQQQLLRSAQLAAEISNGKWLPFTLFFSQS
jgi:hypothetical protein